MCALGPTQDLLAITRQLERHDRDASAPPKAPLISPTEVQEFLFPAHRIQIHKSHIGIDRTIDHELFIWSDIHVGDSPRYPLSIDLRSERPIVRVARIIQTYRLLTRTVVQVPFLRESATVDPGIVGAERAEVLVWDKPLIVL